MRPELVASGGSIDLPIELIEELGTGRLVHGRLGGDAFTVLQGPGTPRPAQDSLRIAIDAATVHVFDAASGARL